VQGLFSRDVSVKHDGHEIASMAIPVSEGTPVADAPMAILAWDFEHPLR
jgi:hypothetical protein